MFRTIVPKDLREYLNDSKEIRISLLTGLKTEAKHLAHLLKLRVDSIFIDIRSGNNTITSMYEIKSSLKEYLYQVKVSGKNGERATESNFFPPPTPKLLPKIQPPMEEKLISSYVNRFQYEDVEDFCDSCFDEYDKEQFPRKHIRRARQNLVKKIGEEFGFREFAVDLSKDIITDYLATLEFNEFKKFLKRNKIKDEQISEEFGDPGDIDVEKLVEFLVQEVDVVPIAKKIGVQGLFQDSGDVYEKNEVKKESESVKNLWDGLRSNGTQLGDGQVSTKAKTSREKPGNTKKLSEVSADYIGEMVAAKIWNPKSELEKRATLKGLVEIIGDLPIDSLSYEIGRDYKNKLMKLPANRKKKARFKDLTIDQILELEDVVPMAIKTVNNNLSTVIALINWSRKQGYLKENYFEGLKIPSEKKVQDERKAFSDSDLKKMFGPETYKEATKGIDHRYWVPLLGLYTGARLNEICQLHVKDINQVDGLWCMDINAKSEDDENPKRLKNTASERLIPLHDKLVELGFIDYVKKQRKAKVVRLFPDLYYNINDGHSRKAGRWFNEQYLRKTLGITDLAKSFHSFRHTVADRLKQLGVTEPYIAELMGHSSGETMSFSRYGKKYQPKLMQKEVINKIDYQINIKRTTK